MAGLAKVVALSGLVQAVYNRWRLPYLVAGAIVMASLTIITSIMLCAAMIAGFYAVFYFLLHNGWLPEDAALMISGMVLLTALFFILLTFLSVQYLRQLPKKLLGKTSGVASQANEVVDAFLDGLMSDEPR